MSQTTTPALDTAAATVEDGPRRGHLLTITPEDDFDPEYPCWDSSITCLSEDLCGGYQSCGEPHEVDGVSAADGPYSAQCPGFHGPYGPDAAENAARAAGHPEHVPWCEVEEFVFHGVEHTWRYGWDWTVPFEGCVVAEADTSEYVYEIAEQHGPGVYEVEDDWSDESCRLDYLRHHTATASEPRNQESSNA